MQGGISGNAKEGCYSVIFSGGGWNSDAFGDCIYTATTKVGARSMYTTLFRQNTIRVFRSNASRLLPAQMILGSGSASSYRYDGLYRIRSLAYLDNSGGITFETPSSVPNRDAIALTRLYFFHLSRVGDGATLDHNLNKLCVRSALSRAQRNSSCVALGNSNCTSFWVHDERTSLHAVDHRFLKLMNFYKCVRGMRLQEKMRYMQCAVFGEERAS